MIDRLGADLKVTRGIVSTARKTDLDADVVVDAKVNPGNSGGPILDRDGNVMAIVSMKSLSSARRTATASPSAPATSASSWRRTR